jgi:hypothetical protein
MNTKMEQVLQLLRDIPVDEQVPLVWTKVGNVESSKLVRHVYWRENAKETALLEEYRLDGEMVRNGLDVKLKQGAALFGQQAKLG